MRKISASFLALWISTHLLCAQEDWHTGIHAGIGANFFLHHSKYQRFPGMRIFGAVSVTGVWRDHLLLHYGPSVSLYTRTIGANMNPLAADLQIDFTHTFSVGGTWGQRISYPKFIRTLHTGDFYNLVLDRSHALVLSTNAIINNHGRHQMQGAASLTLGRTSFNYHNDGPPFPAMMLSDGFDRYWTGGGALFIHDPMGFNRVVAGFDQFTGYQPLLYELSNILGINLPQYENGSRGKTTRHDHNTSQYHLRIGLDPRLSVDMGIVGSLYHPPSRRYFGLQDIIHLKRRFPFHPNQDANRLFIGAGFNLQTSVQ
jgi:hypothetical protein